jgi:FkbM family methyltransferase
MGRPVKTHWYRYLLDKLRYRITHGSKFPKGDLLSFMLELARRGFEPAHIVDVGANRAKWSRWAHMVYPNAHYTLIEPQVELRPQLDAFCRRCRNARWIAAGVGSHIGTLPLTIRPDTVSSSFLPSAEEARHEGHPRRMVPVITLDHLVENEIHAIPDVVKVDAEGFEVPILEGAESLMGKTEVFLLEAHFHGPANSPCRLGPLIGMMADRGYAPYGFTTFHRRRSDHALALCEIAFARENGFLRAEPADARPVKRAA